MLFQEPVGCEIITSLFCIKALMASLWKTLNSLTSNKFWKWKWPWWGPESTSRRNISNWRHRHFLHNQRPWQTTKLSDNNRQMNIQFVNDLTLEVVARGEFINMVRFGFWVLGSLFLPKKPKSVPRLRCLKAQLSLGSLLKLQQNESSSLDIQKWTKTKLHQINKLTSDSLILWSGILRHNLDG